MNVVYRGGTRNMNMNIGVLGAGTWGIALARMLSNQGYQVTVWSALKEEVVTYTRTRTQPNLPGMVIPDEIVFTDKIEDACAGRNIILFAVPSVYVRDTAAKAAPYVNRDQIIIDVAKGIEASTLKTMTQVIKDEFSKAGVNPPLVALSGPTHAEEVALDMPSTIVAASKDLKVAGAVQDVFMNTCMRVYTNYDVLGVELCGALKNIIALAAGISSGLGYGDNAKAAIITRGMAEITRLGVAMGCTEQTFGGLAGIGDLIVTATSEHSRNNRAGQLIGSGMTAREAADKVGMVVEGINALPAAVRLSEKYHVEMPIVKAVNDVVNNGLDAGSAVRSLMDRDKKTELPQPVLDLYFGHTVTKNGENADMKRVITYGTFDMLHYGHINFLRRAKALGDYLIVVLSTDEFSLKEKNKKCYFNYEQRKALVESVRYVDLVIPETSWEQKRSDIHEYHIDTFVMGDDWTGKFDYLEEEGAEVVYLPRTPEISTTQIKHDLNESKQ